MGFSSPNSAWTVRQTQAQNGEEMEHILTRLTLPPAIYYRWWKREREDCLEDTVAISPRRVASSTAEEREAVRRCALAHLLLGYRRLSWLIVDEELAYLRLGRSTTY